MDDFRKVDIETHSLDKILLKIFADKWEYMQDMDEVTSDFPTEKADKMLRKYKRVCRLNNADDIRQNIIDLTESRGDSTPFSLFEDIIDAVELGLDSDWE